MILLGMVIGIAITLMLQPDRHCAVCGKRLLEAEASMPKKRGQYP